MISSQRPSPCRTGASKSEHPHGAADWEPIQCKYLFIEMASIEQSRLCLRAIQIVLSSFDSGCLPRTLPLCQPKTRAARDIQSIKTSCWCSVAQGLFKVKRPIHSDRAAAKHREPDHSCTWNNVRKASAPRSLCLGMRKRTRLTTASRYGSKEPEAIEFANDIQRVK